MKIVSGGQTGVDRAALDAAIACGIKHGGWCPKGRRAEDGPLADRYHLRETDSAEYFYRTEKNVLESDATLILCLGTMTGGTYLTYELARHYDKPCRVVDFSSPEPAEAVAEWILNKRIGILNVAGPRESQNPGIFATAYAFLFQTLQGVAQEASEDELRCTGVDGRRDEGVA
jgi:hypothetical protein